MIAPVFDLLKESIDITLLVGDPPSCRIYGFGYAPERTPTPYIVWQVVGGNPETYLAERTTLDYARVQIDIYATDPAQCRLLTAAVLYALDRHGTQLGQPMDSFETETKLYRSMIEFGFWIDR